MRALEYREEKKRTEPVPIALKRKYIIGNSPAITKCLDQLAMAAAGDIGVLITGETGTGKEVFAKAIHLNSHRADKNFIVVDCASLPENLIESTLFGHVKGAFTGATEAMGGLVKLADGGTLFLDEVGELPLQTQKSFLRVLQEKRFRPVGSSKELSSDFRLVAATNRDLEKMVEAGDFRQDLLFRLQAFTMHLPPLRERLEDIKDLTSHFINDICERYGHETKGFAPDFLETLKAYDWPGNVRELLQSLEQAYTMSYQSPTLYSTHLPEKIRVCQARTAVGAESQNSPEEIPAPSSSGPVLPFQEARENFEKEYLSRILSQANGNISAASNIAGLSRTHLYRLMTKYDMTD
jgi:two-component system NtrC family response regulator